ncbi:nucleotidyltransferase family protein [Candidatus Bipolaricaulota bacterium]|nr:nucleotidyltransferase family protein [Candidatus Bipolaricaulota bacterium]
MTAVVLAAGPGRRMGNVPKLLLPMEGRPILAHVLDLVEGLPVSQRVMVVGAHADLILKSLFSLPEPPSLDFGVTTLRRGGVPWQVVFNPHWEEGLGSSLRRAAEVVAGSMLVFLGDMPWVPKEAALAVLSRVGERPVAPVFCGQRGFPVYLPSSLRPSLFGLFGDVGARNLLQGCELIPVDHPGVVRDVDTPADLVGGEVPCGKAP